MDVRTDSKTGPPIPAWPQLLAQITATLRDQQPAWVEQLRQQPERLDTLEVQVHQAFQQLADQVVAGLLAQAGSHSAPLTAAQKK